MTPEEAIYVIKEYKPILGFEKYREALNVAISALEEIQQYRAIGTVEECRESREKQKKKRPIKILVDPFEYDYDYVCPNCRNELDGPALAEYCHHCGQAIKWKETK